MRLEQAEWFQVQCILWRERALIAEAEVRSLRAALSEALEAVRPLKEQCLTCGREMYEHGSDDDRNCGGDCWGCIREVEEGLLDG